MYFFLTPFNKMKQFSLINIPVTQLQYVFVHVVSLSFLNEKSYKLSLSHKKLLQKIKVCEEITHDGTMTSLYILSIECVW